MVENHGVAHTGFFCCFCSFLCFSTVPVRSDQVNHIFSGENLLYLTNIPKGTKQELVKLLSENWGKGVKKVQLQFLLHTFLPLTSWFMPAKKSYFDPTLCPGNVL